jgi:DNA-binding MarR family transcriptional regulator
VEENIGITLAHVSRLMRRTFDERARAIGITRPQSLALAALKHNPGINQGGLAELLEVEPITAGRMIDRLQEAQLVERRPDPGDRRAWLLFLTDRGDELVDQLRPFAFQTFEIALEGIATEERAALLSTLERIRSNLSRRSPAKAENHG